MSLVLPCLSCGCLSCGPACLLLGRAAGDSQPALPPVLPCCVWAACPLPVCARIPPQPMSQAPAGHMWQAHCVLSLCAAGTDGHVHSRLSDSTSVRQEWGTPLSSLSRPEGSPSGLAFSPLADTLFPASGTVSLPSLHSQLSQQCLKGQPIFSSSARHCDWLVLQRSAWVHPAAWAASCKHIANAVLLGDMFATSFLFVPPCRN